ncbi:MAG TPA: M50 family metallopeptidase, partial [Ginsengibacter sp.]|nr:M50 family metallopeptidase [Ginsengibacter sp.]
SNKINYFDELADYLQKKKSDSVLLSVLRDGQPIQVKALVNMDGKIGINILGQDEYDSLGIFKLETKKFGFFASFPAGIQKARQKLDDYIQSFKQIFHPETGAYKGLTGFKGMASIFPDSGWNWQAFWNITAFFSIILAFMNLLPIPALDGGHVLFTLIEMISGRKPSDKFLEYAQIAGMVILFALMLFANGNDWFGWGRGH